MMRNDENLRYFFSRATSTSVDADDEAEGVYARWADFGDWQAWCVERPPEVQRPVALPAPRRRAKGWVPACVSVDESTKRGPRGSKDSWEPGRTKVPWPRGPVREVKRKAEVLSEDC